MRCHLGFIGWFNTRFPLLDPNQYPSPGCAYAYKLNSV
jgi:hypothetical protein